jgi:hypothetical protein
MIIWINGPFGVGKTTLARKLAEVWPKAIFFDPERVGHMLWSQVPKELQQEEFENEPIWIELTFTMARRLHELYGRPLVIPMTLAYAPVFDTIIGGLRRSGIEVHHFALLAEAKTVQQRLLLRGEREDSWESRQVERCLAALHRPIFAHHLHTDGRTTDDLIVEVQEVSGMHRLEPSGRSCSLAAVERDQ